MSNIFATDQAMRIRDILAGQIPTKIALQPIYNLSDLSVYGYEALARWPGFSPDVVLLNAHNFNLVHEIELVLLDKFITILKKITDPLFINVCPTLTNPTMYAKLIHYNVVLEITEIASINYEGVEKLRDYGFSLALDDIGKGYSTLDSLTRIQPEYMKLDKCLIQSPNHEGRNSLIKAFGDHARRIDAKLVVEGIETKEQLHAACCSGAHYGQGYYLSKPITANI